VKKLNSLERALSFGKRKPDAEAAPEKRAVAAAVAAAPPSGCFGAPPPPPSLDEQLAADAAADMETRNGVEEAGWRATVDRLRAEDSGSSSDEDGDAESDATLLRSLSTNPLPKTPRRDLPPNLAALLDSADASPKAPEPAASPKADSDSGDDPLLDDAPDAFATRTKYEDAMSAYAAAMESAAAVSEPAPQEAAAAAVREPAASPPKSLDATFSLASGGAASEDDEFAFPADDPAPVDAPPVAAPPVSRKSRAPKPPKMDFKVPRRINTSPRKAN
jgi:hypothetical protein